MNKWRKVTLGIVVVLLLAIVSACAPGGVAPPPPEKPGAKVKVMVSTCFTGGPAEAGTPPDVGCLAAYEYYAARDNIPIEVRSEDTGCDARRDLLVYSRARAAGCAIFSCVTSASAVVCAKKAEKDREMVVNHHAPWVKGDWTEPERWCFAAGVSYGLIAAGFTKWIKDTWTDTTRNPRIGALIYDNAAAWDGLDAIQWVCEREGMDFVGYEVVPFLGTLDTTTELMRLADKNPDWLYLGCCGTTGVTALHDITKLGLKEKGIKFIWFPAGLVDFFTAFPEELEGMYHAINAPNPEAHEDTPEIQAFYEAGKRIAGWPHEKMAVSAALQGWLMGRCSAEAIRLAIENVGAVESVTGKDIRDAMVTIKELEVGGLVPPISVSEEKPFPGKEVIIGKVEGGKYVYVSEWFEPPPYPIHD